MGIVHHGIKLAANAVFENFVIENLESDPVVTTAGRAWFNTTDKEWKLSTIDGSGALAIMTLPSEAELAQAVTDLRAELASTDADKGTSIIGFDGQAGANEKITVEAGTLQASLKQVINVLDGDMQSLVDYISSNDSALAAETAERIAKDGDLTTLTTTAKDNLVAAINEVKSAMEAADAALDAKIDQSVADLVDGAPELLDTLNELAAAINDDENFSTTVATDIANAKSELKGAATEAMDTMGEIEAVIGDWTTKSSDIDATTLTGAVNELQSEILNVTSEQSDAVDAVQAELDATQTGAGLAADGSYVAQSGSNYIDTATSLDSATVKLDAALKAEETARTDADTTLTDNLAQEVSDRTAAVSNEQSRAEGVESNLQAELDATQTGAGLAVSGGYVVNNDANYIASAESLNDADVKLDASLKSEETARTDADTALDTRVTTVENQVNGKIGDLSTLTTDEKDTLVGSVNEVDAHVDAAQAELDVTQTGAGLAADGSFVVKTDANYTSESVSLMDSDNKLDAALKAEETARIAADTTLTDNLAQEVSDRTAADTVLTDNLAQEVQDRTDADTALDTRVTDLEDAVDGATGDLSTLTTDAKDTLVNAINEVDAHADAAQAELDVTQTGAGLGTDGAYVVNSSANYIASAASLNDADVKLDAALKAEETARTTADADALTNLNTNFLNKTTTDGQNVASSQVQFEGNIKIIGDIIQQGNTVTAVGEEVTFEDNIVVLNSNVASDATPSEDCGWAVNRGVEGQQTMMMWDETADAMRAFDANTGNLETLAFDHEVATLESAMDARVTDLENAVDGATGDLADLTTDAKDTLVAAINEVDAHADAAQAELDVTQTGAGLAVDGTYVANTSADYISTATSLNDADVKLDAALKAEETARISSDDTLTSNLSQEVSDRTDADAAIQAELDATQTGAGLAADGSYVAQSGSNYIDAATSIDNATVKLDEAIKSEADTRSASSLNLQNELDATQTGAGLGTDGAYTANSSTNYMKTSTSIVSATEDLDTALKARVDTLAAQDVDASGSETVGYDGVTGTNGQFSLAAGTVAASLDSVAQEIDSVKQTGSDLKAAINSTRFKVDSESALTHTITHNLGSQFVDVKVWVLDNGVYKNAIVGESIIDNNTVEISLTEEFAVRVIIESMDQLV